MRRWMVLWLLGAIVCTFAGTGLAQPKDVIYDEAQVPDYGRAGLGVEKMPPPDNSVGDFIGYHVRTGDHDVTAFDWEQYMDFAEGHFK